MEDVLCVAAPEELLGEGQKDEHSMLESRM